MRLMLALFTACGAAPTSVVSATHQASEDIDPPGTCHPNASTPDMTCSRWPSNQGQIEDLVCDPGVSPPFQEGPVQLEFPPTCGVTIAGVGDLEWHADGVIGTVGSLGTCTGCSPVTGAGGGPEVFRMTCPACRFTLRIIEAPLDGGR